MLRKRFMALAFAIPLLAPAGPALAQTVGPNPNCSFQAGFGTIAGMIPAIVGSCVTDQQPSDNQGNIMQETSTGLLTWTKATNVTEFTTGTDTWVLSGYGLIMRDGSIAYPWEGTTSIVAGVAINKNGQLIDPRTGQVIPTDAHIKTS
ncbi:MAG TPA: hypothetical protein VF157_04910 [Chloroflexota bacterium]